MEPRERAEKIVRDLRAMPGVQLHLPERRRIEDLITAAIREAEREAVDEVWEQIGEGSWIIPPKRRSATG